jgi:hypothetical protein
MYPQKAAEAKQSAAKARNPSIKRAFEEVAAGLLVLAEQTGVDGQSASLYSLPKTIIDCQHCPII